MVENRNKSAGNVQLTNVYFDKIIIFRNIYTFLMSRLYEQIIKPLLFKLSPEVAHEAGIKAMRSGLAGAFATKSKEEEILKTDVFGLTFKNPVGIAAGFDKNGVVVEQLAALGFGFVEVGTVTLRPQPGNPKPRLFRLPQDKALINRLGFNNEGAEKLAKRLSGKKFDCIVGVNIGKNRDVSIDEAIPNYLECLEIIHEVADYITVNISSPNTPDLRKLQHSDHLSDLLSAVQEKNFRLGKKPLLVKIAPDLNETEIAEITTACIKHSIDGIIATNTTIDRNGLVTKDVNKIGDGGVSGLPLKTRSTDVIKSVYKASCGKMPIIGVGGIFNAEDAFEKFAAGASLVQLYTGFIYQGPGIASDINAGLAERLKNERISSILDIVGSDLV